MRILLLFRIKVDAEDAKESTEPTDESEGGSKVTDVSNDARLVDSEASTVGGKLSFSNVLFITISPYTSRVRKVGQPSQ